MVKQSKVAIKKEFDLFAGKIAQLESLRSQFELLDCTGFEKEAALIKTKLRNVNSIPEVEKDIARLRTLIESKRMHGSKIPSDVSKKISKLKKGFEADTKEIKKKIDRLEKEIARKKKVKTKKQLSSHEISFVKDIPQLESELKELRAAFSEHTRLRKVKVDSGVGVLVDTKFDDFVASIKGELSERLKERELTQDVQLKTDLELREKLFSKKYSDLVHLLHEKYKEQVHKELQREVKRHFEEIVARRIAQERHSFVNALIKENAIKLQAERKALIDALEGEYSQKEAIALMKMNHGLEQGRAKLARLKEEGLKEIKAQKKAVKSLELKKRAAMNAAIKRKEKELKEEERCINEEIKQHRTQFIAQKERHMRQFSAQVEHMKRALHDELRAKTESLKKEYEQKLGEELAVKESQMKSALEGEYRAKLHEAIRANESQLAQKKAILEKHVMEQAKRLFH